MADTSLPPPFEAYVGPLPYAFVSYAHRDAANVFPEMVRLHAQGYRLWYDEGIDPGNEWPEEVARALESCSYFIVFVSPVAVRSQNVRNEIHFALNKGKPFLAIHTAETALPSGLELRMGDIQAIMKYRMSQDSYSRKVARVLPTNLSAAKVAPAARSARAPEKDVKSISGDVATTMIFVNNSGEMVKVYWIDYHGKRKFYMALKDGESYQQPTYLTHPWLITDEDGNSWDIYFPDAEPRTVEILAPNKD
jgi:hypothetical protein